jgi:uncharacterized radical SAM superfamily Fe-S cluster-containing enzyme
VERLASMKEDLNVQLHNKDVELAGAKNEASWKGTELNIYEVRRCCALRCWNCWRNATLKPRQLHSPSALSGPFTNG